MKTRRIRYFIILFFFVLWGAPLPGWAKLPVVKEDSLSLLTEEWPPFTFEVNGSPQGFAVDVVEEIQATIKDQSIIQVVPWTRGYRIVQSQPNVVFFTVLPTKEHEKMFTLLGPLGSYEIALFGFEKRFLHLHSLEDAKKWANIAAKEDSLFATSLENAGFENLVLTNNPLQEARLLLAGRVDLISSDPLVIQTVFKTMGLGNIPLKKYFVVEKHRFYIAFSKGTSKQTIHQWKNALMVLKKNGSFQKISQKWLADREVLPEVEVLGLIP